MSFQAGRFSGLLTLFVSILLATGIGAIYYYYKIEQNEKYQNQLHFRELKDISRLIDSGLEQFRNLIKEKRGNESELDKQIAELEAFRKDVNERIKNLDVKKYELNEKKKLQAQAIGEIREKNTDKMNEQNAIETKLTEKKTALNGLAEEIKSTEGEYNATEKNYYMHLSRYAKDMARFDIELRRNIYKQCQLSDDLNKYCQWFESFFERLLNIDSYGNNKAEPFLDTYNAQYQSIIDNKISLVRHLDERLKEINKLEEQINHYREMIKSSTTKIDLSNIRENLKCENINITFGSFECNFLLESLEKFNELINADVSVSNENVLSNQDKYRLQSLEQLKDISAVVEKNHFLQSQKIKFIDTVFSILSDENFNNTLQEIMSKLVVTRDELSEKEIQKIEFEGDIYVLEKSLENLLKSNPETEQEYASLEMINAEVDSINEDISFIENTIKVELDKKRKENVSISVSSHLPYILTAAIKRNYRELVNCLIKKLKFTDKKLCKIENIRDKYHEYEINNSGKNDKINKFVKLGRSLKRLEIIALDNYKDAEKYGIRNWDEDLSDSAPFLIDKNNHIASLIKEYGGRHRYYHVPFDDFLGSDINHYPLLLVLDKQGKRIAKKENPKNGSGLHGLNFGHLKQMLIRLLDQQEPKSLDGSGNTIANNIRLDKSDKPNVFDEKQKGILSGPGYSGYIDIEITGIEYRVFITPYETAFIQDVEQKGKLNSQYYLFGFKLKSQLISKKLSISNNLIVLIVLFLMLMVALIPLLKLRFISSNNAITIQDRRWLLNGAILLAGVLCIGIFDQLFYNQLKKSINLQAEEIFDQLQVNFKEEVGALNQYAEKEKNLNASNTWQEKNLPFEEKHAKKDKSYFLENLFILPEDGKLVGQAKWSSKDLHLLNDIDLSGRSYFKNAIDDNIWCQVDDDNACVDRFYLQRIFNIRDGRTTTQFSKQIKLNNNKQVLSFGAKLQVFFAPVLPQHFGFLVFENKSGEVLYHSDDERSLIENIYVETDNNPNLHSLEWLGSKTNYNNNSVLMRTVYRGEDHEFQVGNLMEDLPLTLVVFYKKNQLRTLNMLSVFTALALFMALLLIAYIVIKLFRRQHLVSQILWFDTTIGKHYLSIGVKMLLASALVNIVLYAVWVNLSAIITIPWSIKGLLWLSAWLVLSWKLNTMLVTRRETELAKPGKETVNKQISLEKNYVTPFTFYLFALLTGFVIIPVLMLSMESSRFYLQKYADMEATHLQNSHEFGKKARERYFKALIDEENQKHFLNLADSVPCYLGVKNNSEKKSFACTEDNLKQGKQDKAKQLWLGPIKDQKREQEEGLIVDAWRLVSLAYPFSEKVWALNRGNRKKPMVSFWISLIRVW